MKVCINKHKAFFVLFAATLLTDAYCITTIGNRNITLFYPVFLFYVLFVLLNPNDLIKSSRNNIFPLVMIVYMLINFIFTDGEFSSLIISELLWGLYLISYRKISISQFNKNVDAYQTFIDILSIYGIYQFIAHMFNLPFADIHIPNHMSTGYNWGNDIVIAGYTFRRSNAIFREPSFFSQFISINLLIYISKIIQPQGRNKRKNYIWMMMNIAALVLTFSGTGILILIGGIVIYIITDQSKEIIQYVKHHLLLVLTIAIVLFVLIFTNNAISSYFWGRLSEFNSSNVESISAYIRFIKPYQATAEILREHPVLGLGIGKSFNYITASVGNLNNALAVALPRSFAELGLIGGFIYVFFMIKAVRKKNLIFSSYRAILIGVYLMTFMHGTWSSEIYWLFLSLLNVELCKNNR